MTNRPDRIRTRIGGCLAVILGLSPMARAADTVKIDSGVLEGAVGTDPSVRVFRGVPFAAPPVGNARWKEPQPAAAWTGVRKADEWGTRCMQGPMFGPLLTRDKQMGEDGLYLNVWTGNPNSAGLPQWPEFGKTHQVMRLDGVSKAVPEPDRARYEFIDGYGSK